MDNNQFVPDGCKRNATTKLSKTADIVRAPVSTHVAARRLRRLRPGICDSSKATDKIARTTKFFGLLMLVMTFSMIMREQQAEAAPIHHRRSHKSTENFTTERHINKIEKLFQRDVCSMEVKWGNACQGTFKDSGNTSTSTTRERVPHRKALKDYKKVLAAYSELKFNTTEIDISDTNTTWKDHKQTYRFLPRLKRGATLKLRSWHRYAQIYVAAFNYLHRQQLYFDLKKYALESKLSRTLKKFEQKARSILCGIETAINITSKSNRPLHIIKLERMQEILNFRTKSKYFFNPTCKDHTLDEVEEPSPADSIDLRFAKKQFLGFLRSMRIIVKRKIASRSSISASSSRSSNSRSSKNYSDIDSGTSASRYQESSLQSLSRSDNLQDLEMDRPQAKLHSKRRHHKTST